MEASSSGEAATTAVEDDSSAINPSRARTTARAATWCCRRRTSRVTSAVTFGLPSRSPPIHVPKVSGCASGESATPKRSDSIARSVASSGSVSSTRSCR